MEWLYSLEHDGETMTNLIDSPVRLLLDSGSGVSVCSPEFAPHVTGSSVRARSATGQVTKSLGKKIVHFDINGIAAGVNSAEDLETNYVCWQDGAFRAQDRSG